MRFHHLGKSNPLTLIVLLLAVTGVMAACGGATATESPSATATPAAGEEAAATDADAVAPDPPAENAAANSGPATTVAQALALLDLRSLSMPQDAIPMGQPEVGSVDVQAPQEVAEVVEFYRSLMSGEGWQEAEDGYVDDTAAALYFTKNGFTVSLSASDMGDGSSSVTLLHHGNINPGSLPETADAETGFAAPNMFMYFSPTSVADVARFVRTELAAQGWHEYTQPHTATANDPDSQAPSFIQNGLELSAFISTAPAQDNKTAVQYTLLLLPLDMPLEPNAANVEFDSSQPYLSYQTATAPDAVAEFYRQQMTDLGWEEIADLAVVTPEQIALQFVNNAQEVALQLLLTEDDHQTNVTLGADIASPVAETETETEMDVDTAAGDSLETEVEAMPAGDMPAVPLPDNAEGVAFDPDFGEITFTSATDIAGLSEFYRQEMAAIGWEEDTFFSIENDTFASIDFNQGDETIILTIFGLDGSSEASLDLSSAPSLTGNDFAKMDEGDDLAIEPPADASTFTINDWPTPPDATDVNLSGEILSYKIAMSLADLAEFYRPTFELMELGTDCLDDVADYTSLSCSSSNGDITLNFFAFEGFEDTEVEIDFVNYNYPVDDDSSGGGSGELTAEDQDGLPLPSDNTGYFSEGSEFSRNLTATSPSDIPTLLEFYQTELTALGWQAENSTTDGDTTIVDFSGPEGILRLTLAPAAGETEATLAVKNPAAAEEAGVLPPTGQARLFLINFSPEALTVTINNQTIDVPVEAGMDSPDTAPSLDLPPGSYTVSFSVSGKALSDKVEIGADESWGLLLDDEGVLPLLVY